MHQCQHPIYSIRQDSFFRNQFAPSAGRRCGSLELSQTNQITTGAPSNVPAASIPSQRSLSTGRGPTKRDRGLPRQRRPLRCTEQDGESRSAFRTKTTSGAFIGLMEPRPKKLGSHVYRPTHGITGITFENASGAPYGKRILAY